MATDAERRLITDLAEQAGDARTALADALARLCPGGDDHGFVQHRDRRPPWCPLCHYTQWGAAVS